jgi:hypothetical protein
LTKEELHKLCEVYDDGSIEDLFYTYLYPVDKKNFPEEYEDPTECDKGISAYPLEENEDADIRDEV